MRAVHVNNLGIPPLAGICSYDEACKEGYSVEHNVSLLKRYNFVKKRLVDVFAAHHACTPEWEVKCAFSLHMWLEAEHSAILRKRVSEMREPPLGLDKVPDLNLDIFMEEVLRSQGTEELLTAIYAVIKPAMIESLHKHIEETNPIADYPTYRLLKQILQDEEEMVTWGQTALEAIKNSNQTQEKCAKWQAHLQSFLLKAGHIHGDKNVAKAKDHGLYVARYDGKPYEMDAMPKRDSRFTDQYNCSAKIDEYYQDTNRKGDERVFALIYKRLREMDVPEWMGPIIYKTKGKPWEYYHDMSRQQWDEARHAMLGEVGMYACGVEFYKYPIDLKSSMTLNTLWTPKDAHAILWAIEQMLMNKEKGKRREWVIAKEAQIEVPIGTLIQDYDWADEVLHAQIGRKWLLPEFSSQDELSTYAEQLFDKWKTQFPELTEKLSTQTPWWSNFVEEARTHFADTTIKR